MDGWITQQKGLHSCELVISYIFVCFEVKSIFVLNKFFCYSKFAEVLTNATIELSVMSFLVFCCLLNPLSIHVSLQRVQLLVTQGIS